MQFDAQASHYERFFETADFDIIEVNGKPAGRLIILWEKEQAKYIDIIILPKYRKRGVASSIMDALIKRNRPTRYFSLLSYEKWKPYLEKYIINTDSLQSKKSPLILLWSDLKSLLNLNGRVGKLKHLLAIIQSILLFRHYPKTAS